MERFTPYCIASPIRCPADNAYGAINVLIVGLGGMGVVGLIHRIGGILRHRFGRAFTTENRGFAQRWASVSGAVRAGHGVRSPELVTGADFVLALEPAEILLHWKLVGRSAYIVMSDAGVRPVGRAGRSVDAALIRELLARRGARVLMLPACAWLAENGLPQI